MTEPLPATLTRLRENGTEPGKDDVVKVQFNPNSLKLSRQGTQSKAGATTKGQDVQYPSTQPATLNFDLEFDTAEEYGDGGAPVDVRRRTDPLRTFLEPPKDKPGSAPPRVKFQWGVFLFLGIVTQISEEFDYFAPNGTPLRAKVGLTIQEQDPKLEAAQRGPGARTDTDPAPPGDGSTAASPTAGAPPAGSAPGHSGTASPQSTVAALAGESVQQLAARVGGNPAAWRSLMTALPSPADLAAGTPVVIGPELRETTGVGTATGFRAAAGTSQAIPGVLGLEPAGLSAPPRGLEAGLVVAAAGGIGAAIRQATAADQARAVSAARAAFDVPQVRASGADPDPRSGAFGRGVPLRARAHPPTLESTVAGGSRSVAARARPVELPATGGGTVPPWVRLPPSSGGQGGSLRRPGDAAAHMIGRTEGGCR
jgi:hypothetical protein